jgi:hypothetical protein
MKEYFSLFLFILFAILVNLSYSAHIDASISFEDKNPFIKMTIGNQTEKLLVSFSSSSIITFPKDKDSTEEPNSKSLENKLDKLTLNKKNKTLTLNEKVKFDLKFQESPSRIKEIGKLDGILGLSQREMNNETFLNQLKDTKKISKKIIFIDTYFENGHRKNKSKINIGELPNDINIENMHPITLNLSKDVYEFKIPDLFIEDNLNKTDINKSYEAKIEEGQIEPISIPKTLFEKLEKYFKDFKEKNCTTKKNTIVCSNKTDIMNKTNIKFKINNYDFQFAIWKNGKFNLKVIDSESIILTSEFTGNYARVYDIDSNKIFFSDFGGYVSKNKESSPLVIVIISVAGLLLIGIIVLIIVICVQRARGKNLTNKVNTVSFTADKADDDDEESLLY